MDSTMTSAQAKAASREASLGAPGVLDEEAPSGFAFPKSVYFMVAGVGVAVVGALMGFFIFGHLGTSSGAPLGTLTPPPVGSNTIAQPTDPPTIAPSLGNNAVVTPAPGGAAPAVQATALPGPQVSGQFPSDEKLRDLGSPVDMSHVPGLDQNPRSADADDPSPIPQSTPVPPSVHGGAVAIAVPDSSNAQSSSQATPDPDASDGGEEHRTAAVALPKNEEPYQHHTPSLPPSPYALRKGWEVSASWIAPLDSDRPGYVRAIQTQDLYGSFALPGVLPQCSWPAGTQYFGKFEAVKDANASGVYAVWTDVAFPNGHEISLPDLAAVDQQGEMGASGHIDRHTAKAIGNALLLTLMQAAITYGTQPRYVVNGQQITPQAVVGQGASSALTPLAQQALSQSVGHVTITAGVGERVDILIFPGIDLGESEC